MARDIFDVMKANGHKLQPSKGVDGQKNYAKQMNDMDFADIEARVAAMLPQFEDDADKQRKYDEIMSNTGTIPQVDDLQTRITPEEFQKQYQGDWNSSNIYKSTDKVPKPESKRKDMANKFLPFVVAKSTPVHIFSTLLTRSKGMNTNTLASVFNAVLHNGVSEIRKFVSELPDMSTEEMYLAIINQYKTARVYDIDLTIFRDMSKFITGEHRKTWSDNTKEFSDKDLMSLTYVLALNKKLKGTCSAPFDLLITDKEIILQNIPDFVNFSDSGTIMEFTDKNELINYIYFRSVFAGWRAKDGSSSDEEPIKAVIADKAVPEVNPKRQYGV